MPRFGAHMSIAGGLPSAVTRAVVHRCESLQIFSKSSGQWRARPLPPDEVRAFRDGVAAAGLGPVFAHASYLINLAASEPGLRQQSLDAFGEELDRAERLGLAGLVIHPGCGTGATEAVALRLVARAVRAAVRRRKHTGVMILLEQTAGQGTAVGWRFEQLARMIELVDGTPRVGICLDTCHLFAAGYDLRTEEGYRATWERFDRLVGHDRLRVMHVNDSKKPLGSRIDRHEHIGQGTLGVESFRRLVNDPRLADCPMILETPKAADRGRASKPDVEDRLDAMNLATLRGLVTYSPSPNTSA